MPYKDPMKNAAAKRAYLENNREACRIKNKVFKRTAYRAMLDWLADYKSTISCSCGENHPACIAFHHRDPNLKLFEINEVDKRHNLQRLKEEIAKCDPMCHNCHSKLHWVEMQVKKASRFA